MLKLKPNPRELVLLLVLAALCLGAAWYYLLFAPLNESLVSLRGQLETTEQQLAERQAWQLHDAETSEKLQALLVEQNKLQAEFDPISHGKDVIDYFVGLASRDNWTNGLEIKPDQITLTILSPTYDRARMVIDNLEKSPNFIPQQLELTPGQDAGGFSLKLLAALTWGQAPPGTVEIYPRTNPFGR